jgi:hypothetical protein
MKHHKLTLEERETIIRTSDADDCWYVFSESPAMIRQLTTLVEVRSVPLKLRPPKTGEERGLRSVDL